MEFRLVMQLALWGLALAVLPACKRYATAEFEVRVTNRTAGALTAGFVKDGGPEERHWAAPHEMAMGGGMSDRWGVVVRPGETRTVGPIRGKFDQGVSAILRVYGTEGELDELLGFSRGDPLRADIFLYPGMSHYVIDMERGRLAPRRAAAPAPAR